MENPAIARSATFAGVVPHFRVSDVAKTAEYYRDVFGFEIDGYCDGEEVHRERARRAVFASCGFWAVLLNPCSGIDDLGAMLQSGSLARVDHE